MCVVESHSPVVVWEVDVGLGLLQSGVLLIDGAKLVHQLAKVGVLDILVNLKKIEQFFSGFAKKAKIDSNFLSPGGARTNLQSSC